MCRVEIEKNFKKEINNFKKRTIFFYIYSVVGNGPYKRTATAPGVSTNVDMSSSGTFSHCLELLIFVFGILNNKSLLKTCKA